MEVIFILLISLRRSLQLICGDSIEAVQLESEHLETEESAEPLSIPVIVGPLAGALLVVVVIMIVIFKRKKSRIFSKTKEKQNEFVTPTVLEHDAVYHNETNVPEITEGLYAWTKILLLLFNTISNPQFTTQALRPSSTEEILKSPPPT
ncbi:uncharacterized protein LOC134271477 [Saccostrea cucullata]|uniref:uncharacterized protein LOC134271477 n=1 Tax=Saccostrea cuccullata TaxID=36930 RepID=UPI002ED09137